MDGIEPHAGEAHGRFISTLGKGSSKGSTKQPAAQLAPAGRLLLGAGPDASELFPGSHVVCLKCPVTISFNRAAACKVIKGRWECTCRSVSTASVILAFWSALSSSRRKAPCAQSTVPNCALKPRGCRANQALRKRQNGQGRPCSLDCDRSGKPYLTVNFSHAPRQCQSG